MYSHFSVNTAMVAELEFAALHAPLQSHHQVLAWINHREHHPGLLIGLEKTTLHSVVLPHTETEVE